MLSDNQARDDDDTEFKRYDTRPRKVSNMSKTRRPSQRTKISASERSQSEMSLDSTFTEGGGIDEKKLRPNYRDIKLTEMMKYYTPAWLAGVGLFASVLAAFQLPLFGYILS